MCTDVLTVADLDGVHVEYSHKRTTLITLTVESPEGYRSAPLEIPEWHLPTFDPTNANKYMYKLHTVDLYFWAKEDALVFVNAVRRLLPPQQVTVLDEPVTPPPHRDPISPVVQKLENVAVSDPSYQNGQTRDSRSNIPSFAGPPISATPQNQPAANFAPIAYNPAAPAAPEVIRHREKTPPPEDGAGNPLVAAAAADHYGHSGLPGPPTQQPFQASYFPQGAIPAPPVSQPPVSNMQSPFAQHFQNQFAPPPTQPTSSPFTSPQPTASPSSQSGQQKQFTSFPIAATTPSTTSLPGSFPQTPQASQDDPNHYKPPSTAVAPPGGFSQFSYAGSQPSNTKPLNSDHGIHSQVYRPTEVESTIKHNDKPVASSGGVPPPGKLEARANKLEKGVGGFLKKLEKKYG